MIGYQSAFYPAYSGKKILSGVALCIGMISVVFVLGCASAPRYRSGVETISSPSSPARVTKPQKHVSRVESTQASFVPLPVPGEEPMLAPKSLSGQTDHDGQSGKGKNFEGEASYYGSEFVGRKTSSGERLTRNGFTAAHRTLPFGTRLRVTNIDNGLSTEVRVNDRGPFAKGRVLDLSYAAARAIAMIGTGTARIRAVVLGN